MLPWNYGFAWDAGHIIFLGVFYLVLLTAFVTLLRAALRTWRDFREGRAAQVMWHANFEDLPRSERACRHAFTGELAGRVCERGFACGGCETHARLYGSRMGMPLPGVVDDSLGFVLPLDRYYHRGHVWAKPEADGTFTLGLDEVARRVAARPDTVELPPVGTRLDENATAWALRVNGGVVRVKMPFAGVVLAAADAGDWTLRVRPAAHTRFDHLLRGAEVVSWLHYELDRVHLAVSSAAALPALADGGAPVADFPAACPQADWPSITAAMFLEN
jgi:glycine cleavage system H lipoate-binding protein